MNCSSRNLQVSLCFNFFINYFNLELIYHHGDPTGNLDGHITSEWTTSPEFRKLCTGAPCQCVVGLFAVIDVLGLCTLVTDTQVLYFFVRFVVVDCPSLDNTID